MMTRIAPIRPPWLSSIQVLSLSSGSSSRGPATRQPSTGRAMVDAAMAVKVVAAAQVSGRLRSFVPIAVPAATHNRSTLGLTTVSAIAARNARGGCRDPMDCIQRGVWAESWRFSHR